MKIGTKLVELEEGSFKFLVDYFGLLFRNVVKDNGRIACKMRFAIKQ